MTESEIIEDELGGWLSGGKEIIIFSLPVLEFIDKYKKPSESVKLYRGEKKSDNVVENDIIFSGMSSWTYSPEYAKYFTDTGRIFFAVVEPSQIILDTTKMDPKFISTIGGFPDEKEVILSPTKLSIKIIK